MLDARLDGGAREALPELPDARRARLEFAYGRAVYDARVLTSEVAARRVLRGGHAAGVEPKAAANWVMGDLAGENASVVDRQPVGDLEPRPARVGQLRQRLATRRPEWIAEQREALPELPDARRARLEIAYGCRSTTLAFSPARSPMTQLAAVLGSTPGRDHRLEILGERRPRW